MISFNAIKVLLMLLISKSIADSPNMDYHSDTECTICVKLGNKTYLIDAYSKENWYNAERFCRRQNGYLANIENQSEMDAISDYLVSKDYLKGAYWFWIGATDLGSEGTFYSTATGNPISFADWSPNQPGGKVAENCVHLWKLMRTRSFKMNDLTCNGLHHFICEIKPSYKFVIAV